MTNDDILLENSKSWNFKFRTHKKFKTLKGLCD